MKVIFDTNVVVSAALKDRLPEAVVVFVIEHSDFEWIASSEIVAEYMDVLRRPKFKLPETIIQRWLDAFQQFVTVVEVEHVVDFPRDAKDAKFLACALSAGAHYSSRETRTSTRPGRLVRRRFFPSRSSRPWFAMCGNAPAVRSRPANDRSDSRLQGQWPRPALVISGAALTLPQARHRFLAVARCVSRRGATRAMRTKAFQLGFFRSCLEARGRGGHTLRDSLGEAATSGPPAGRR